ncbi:probable salivary secreted peptide [Eupeodes corollae]|uniref:probable salivary secreted peptide n=1 Tax=Eupeodes corollae TaxID=290404 RepID=UPI002490F9E4|nr:probable salivary secreted peptide [Eupeodes corollae]
MKHLEVLTFAVFAATWIAISQGLSSRYGFKSVNDELIHRQFVVVGSSWWRRVTADVVFPPPGYVNTKIISAIYVIDQTGGTNTTTGYASLSKGGPGEKNVTLHIKAPYGVGLNFTVEIYGLRDYNIVNHRLGYGR